MIRRDGEQRRYRGRKGGGRMGRENGKGMKEVKGEEIREWDKG